MNANKFHLLFALLMFGGCSPSAGGGGSGGDGGTCRALGDPCTNLTGSNGCCTSICRNRGGTNACACLAFSEACVESVQCCEVRFGGMARPGRCIGGTCG